MEVAGAVVSQGTIRQTSSRLANQRFLARSWHLLLSPVYDDVVRAVKSIDALGHYTLNVYDDADNVIEVYSKDSSHGTISVAKMGYDAAGRLSWRNINSGTTSFTYDNLGRTAQVTQPDPDDPMIVGTTFTDTLSSLPRPFTTYGYDKNGNQTTSVNALGKTTTIAFDDQPGLVKTKFNNTFDVAGRRTIQKADITINSVTTHDFQNEYGYDAKNRLTGLKQTVQGSGGSYSVIADKYITFGYNGQDQIIDIDRYANTTTSNLVAHSDYDRDFAGRLTTIDHFKGGTHFATYGLEYDARSRISAIDSVFSNSAWDETHDFGYDDTDQLTSADHSVQDDEAYAYDENGNRTGNQTHLGATTSSIVTANNRISSDGVYNYTYDDEGNMLTKTSIATGDIQAFGWDHRNRLVSVTLENSSNVIQQKLEFQYDHNDDMVLRIDTPYSGGVAGTATKDAFVFDNSQIVLAYHKGTSGDAYLTNRYLWANEIDHLISDEQVTSLSSAGTVYWSLGNHLNSVVDLVTYNSGTDTTSVAKHRRFDSFGNIVFDSASGVVQRMAYTGVMFEESFGSTWHRKRWFDVQLGQWKSEDPIGFFAGDGNLRRYVGNEPVARTDPSGLIYISKPPTWSGGLSEYFTTVKEIGTRKCPSGLRETHFAGLVGGKAKLKLTVVGVWTTFLFKGAKIASLGVIDVEASAEWTATITLAAPFQMKVDYWIGCVRSSGGGTFTTEVKGSAAVKGTVSAKLVVKKAGYEAGGQVSGTVWGSAIVSYSSVTGGFTYKMGKLITSGIKAIAWVKKIEPNGDETTLWQKTF